MEKPLNQGECRKSLDLLRDCGYMDGLLKLLSTDAKTGIIGSETDIRRRTRIFGSNRMTLPTITPFLDHWAR